MARLFDGVDDYGQITTPFSSNGYQSAMFSWWMWWDSFANNDHMAIELGSPHGEVAGGVLFDPNEAGSGKFLVEFSNGAQAKSVMMTRPSANAWHHYLVCVDRLNKVINMFFDGTQPSLTSGGAMAGSGGTFLAATPLNVMSRQGTSLFAGGRMADLAIWAASSIPNFTLPYAQALYAGFSPWTIRPDILVLHVPFAYSSATVEPNWGTDKSASGNMTISGAVAVASPNLRPSIWLPRLSAVPF